MVTITFEVEGMRCGMCEAHVNDAVRNSAPVKKVKSSHRKHQTVVKAEDASLAQQIKAGIEAQGYKVLSVSVEE